MKQEKKKNSKNDRLATLLLQDISVLPLISKQWIHKMSIDNVQLSFHVNDCQ